MRANEIFVLSRQGAIDFRPKRDTYVIRIFGRDNPPFKLNYLDDKNIVQVDEYTFDHFDIEGGNKKVDFIAALKVPPEQRRFKIFTRKDANRLLENFVKYFREGMDLMVHCREGRNRSPGFTCALDDLFGLLDFDLMRRYPDYDRHVYRKILRAGLFNGLVTGERRDRVEDLLSKPDSEQFCLLSFFK
jgi:hypothetical protein